MFTVYKFSIDAAFNLRFYITNDEYFTPIGRMFTMRSGGEIESLVSFLNPKFIGLCIRHSISKPNISKLFRILDDTDGKLL